MRVALIHAVVVAMQPIHDAFRRSWPEAELANILDDSLSRDREKDAELTPAMFSRIGSLARYAIESGAQGVLFTCSAFGEAIDAAAAAAKVPVLKPNEAMFAEALAVGRRVGMLATFAPSVASMEDEFREMARQRQADATIESYCVPGAMAALRAGDGAKHDALIAEAAPRFRYCDAILLAHFSTARADAAVSAVMDCPVLTAPGAAVAKLKSALSRALV
ncbi:MAG TPA: aspartate/glutamate racemase family protein [Alphaproteobacteria bacterium]|nr:aspartate/glutamate racemase family protein [Alphaproteobacteria bacterium]